VDCTLCVQVCPTGIDIRNGLQYECIGCAACIDVCDQVMDKVGYPRGLIKYSTQNGMAQGWTVAEMMRRALRPRVLVYTGILLAITVAVFASLWMRVPLKVDVMRDRGSLARLVDQGKVENVYRLQVMNATEQAQVYRLTVSGLPGIAVVSDATVDVLPTEARSVAVTVQIPPGPVSSGSHPIVFELVAEQDPAIRVAEKSVFIVPR